MRALHGADGLATMGSGSLVDISSTPDVAAEVIHVSVGDLQLALIESDAYTAVRRAAHIAKDPRDAIQIVIVRKGGIRVEQDGRRSIHGPGAATMLRTRAPYKYSVVDGSRVVAIEIPCARLTSLPLHLVHQATAIALPRPTTIRGTADFLEHYINSALDGHPIDATVDIAILSSMGQSVLVVPESQPTAPSDSLLLVRAREVIASRVGDANMTPTTLADELGVSSRQLYRVFEAAGSTVAAAIRDIRLDQAAELLRSDAPAESRDQMAARFGYANADSFARAFRTRFGQSMGDYRRAERSV